MDFGQRVKTLRESLKLTQTDLANSVGYSDKTAISRIETGKSDVSRGKIVLLADVLGTSPSYLMGWTDDPSPKRPFNISDIPGVMPLHKAHRVPILGTIACGKPVWAEENYDGYFVVDSKIDADFCLVAKGDSMIDEGINDGDIAFFKKTSIVDNGGIAAILIDNEATLKKFYKTSSGIILQPGNDTYEPVVITEEDFKDVIILGELVGHYHERRLR